MRICLLAALCGLLGSVAQAQEGTSGFFAGVSVGSFRFSERDQATGAKIADTTSVHRLLGGYRLGENTSIEASWAKTGDIEASVDIDDPVLGPARLVTRADFEVLTLRVVGTRPLERVTLFGGFGVYEGDLDETGRFEDDFGITTYTYHEGDRGLTLIGGVQFELRPRVSLRAEYEWFDGDSMGSGASATLWNAGLSLLFKF